MSRRPFLAVAVLSVCALSGLGISGSVPMGGGFIDHGVGSPYSTTRGVIATSDSSGDAILAWLMDIRGTYALLHVHPDSGTHQEIPLPVYNNQDSVYHSLLSRSGALYTSFGYNFMSYDKTTRRFTFWHNTTGRFCYGMYESDDGVIYAAMYPDASLISYDPKSGAFRDWGQLNNETWTQYPVYLAVDDAGWVYMSIGDAKSQVVMLDPATGAVTKLLTQEQRLQGSAYVYRDVDGKVYASSGPSGMWYSLHKGVSTLVGASITKHEKLSIDGHAGWTYPLFPSGKTLVSLSTLTKSYSVRDPASNATRTHSFDYTSEGSVVMAVAAGPGGVLYGASAFPMVLFTFDIRTDRWTHKPAELQYNVMTTVGNTWWAGGYTQGRIVRYDPSKPYSDTCNSTGNPAWLAAGFGTLYRPRELVLHSDGSTLIMGGDPGAGKTGGGLLFYSTTTGQTTLLNHTQVVQDQSVYSIASLPGNKLLLGTTIWPGASGVQKATVAELAIMDFPTKKIEWHQAVLPGVERYSEAVRGPGNLVYLFADLHVFVVFDFTTRTVVHQRDYAAIHGYTDDQEGVRTFFSAPNGTIYVLFQKGPAFVRADWNITLLARPSVWVGGGGALLNGRLYYFKKNRVYSYELWNQSTNDNDNDNGGQSSRRQTGTSSAASSCWCAALVAALISIISL